MSQWYGWMGTILRINLSTGKIAKEALSEKLACQFIGGRGLNSKILYDETGPETDPLGPENRLIVGTGPTTGTLGLGNSRFTITGKSPLTGILGDASGGGAFGAEVKFAGYDHVIVQGQADKPIYLWIDDGEIKIKDAAHLWGKTTGKRWISSGKNWGMKVSKLCPLDQPEKTWSSMRPRFPTTRLCRQRRAWVASWVPRS